MARTRINRKIIAGAIEDYVRSIQGKIKVNKIILFGSVVNGQYSENSDIDLIVISRDFAKMELIERLEFLSCARTGKSRKIAMDIFGYTPAEFNQMSGNSALVADAATNGKVVWEKEA